MYDKDDTFFIGVMFGTLVTAFIAVIGFQAMPTCEEKEPEKIVHEKKVYVHDRLQSCEVNGGKYSMFWDRHNTEYYERCTVQEADIKNF